ncbi:ergosterol biosynthetic protein 28 homolog isoform X3 [Pristis pectinata]|uniref:ergosterol biosynthetic protein 28 homolog isoform X3 n=1 Tax=Pristis pectinata TaxID=685728 RepID=UPI00223DA4BB|nr:ergosterol biosynthetic protein 28 homolog isoform X3 [Pristis pectinata]
MDSWMSRFLNVLRSWLVMVAVIAAGNTIQSFRDHSFLSEKLYTGKPALVNGLQARTFGIWTLLSSIIRCTCAVDIQNRTTHHNRRHGSPLGGWLLHPGNAGGISVHGGYPGGGFSSTKEENLSPSG